MRPTSSNRSPVESSLLIVVFLVVVGCAGTGAPESGAVQPDPSVGADGSPSAQAAVPGSASEEEEEEEERGVVSDPEDFRRISMPSPHAGEASGYTLQVPLTWQTRRDLPLPGVLLGPPVGNPNSHPEMILVRRSDVAVSDPELVLQTLRSNADRQEWELVEAEIRDFGGVTGLWIVRELPPSGLDGERVNLAVKLPFGAGSLDLVATVPQEQRAELEPLVRQILSSVQGASEAPSGD